MTALTSNLAAIPLTRQPPLSPNLMSRPQARSTRGLQWTEVGS